MHLVCVRCRLLMKWQITVEIHKVHTYLNISLTLTINRHAHKLQRVTIFIICTLSLQNHTIHIPRQTTSEPSIHSRIKEYCAPRTLPKFLIFFFRSHLHLAQSDSFDFPKIPIPNYQTQTQTQIENTPFTWPPRDSANVRRLPKHTTRYTREKHTMYTETCGQRVRRLTR